MVTKGSSVRVRQRALSYELPAYAYVFAEVGDSLRARCGPCGNFLEASSESTGTYRVHSRAPVAADAAQWRALVMPVTTGLSGSREVFRDRVIPFDLDVVARAAGCPVAGRGHRSGSSENEHRPTTTGRQKSSSSGGLCRLSARMHPLCAACEDGCTHTGEGAGDHLHGRDRSGESTSPRLSPPITPSSP